MDTVTQVIDDQIIPCQPDLTHADLAAPGEEETIASDIVLNWKAYRNLQRSVKKSHKKLQSLGKSLGESMYRLKILLAKPGRKGNWSAFLRENEVSRTTADRLISAYERSLNPDVNCTNGAIQPMTQDAVRKLCAAIWSRSNKKLTTNESVYWFLCEMARVSGARQEIREGGIFVFESPLETAPESSSPVALLSTSEGRAAVASQVSDKVQ